MPCPASPPQSAPAPSIRTRFKISTKRAGELVSAAETQVRFTRVLPAGMADRVDTAGHRGEAGPGWILAVSDTHAAESRAMLNLLRITLEARNPEQGLHRSYTVQLGRDLLGAWVVSITYGHAGVAGQMKFYPFDDLEAARKRVKAALKRRLSAPGRIGVPYVVRELSVAPGFEIASWLPPGLGPLPPTAAPISDPKGDLS